MPENEDQENEVNKQLLNDSILLLGKAYNSPKKRHIEQAISLLQKSLKEQKTVAPIHYKDVPIIKDGFISTGVRWLDEWLGGGIRCQEFMLIGATPHGGKTHWLTWIGSQFILEGRNVLHINGEDILSDVKESYSVCVESEEALSSHLFFVDMQDSRFGVREVESCIDQLKEKGVEVFSVILDHVDLMKTSGQKADWEAISDVMADLKMLAKRTGTFIVTASQMNFPNPAVKGMARFYRAKVGKAGEPDIILMVDEVMGQEYMMSRVKARGRKKLVDAQKTIECPWDTMKLVDIT